MAVSCGGMRLSEQSRNRLVDEVRHLRDHVLINLVILPACFPREVREVRRGRSRLAEQIRPCVQLCRANLRRTLRGIAPRAEHVIRDGRLRLVVHLPIRARRAAAASRAGGSELALRGVRRAAGCVRLRRDRCVHCVAVAGEELLEVVPCRAEGLLAGGDGGFRLREGVVKNI
jgi:hypothetical protein